MVGEKERERKRRREEERMREREKDERHELRIQSTPGLFFLLAVSHRRSATPIASPPLPCLQGLDPGLPSLN